MHTPAKPPDADPCLLLRVENLSKAFPLYANGFWQRHVATVRAVNDVSFDVLAGETLGLVGESGCGKTTLARTILRALRPTAGHAWFHTTRGRDSTWVDLAAMPARRLKPLRTRMQMIFQDPFSSLNPRMTVGDIVAEPLKIHRLASASRRRDRVADMLQRVGLEDQHRSRYPHEFSGGQRQRIGIARALVMRPAFVVCDEAVSALDVSVQAQVINLLADLQHEFGLTYLFVAHDLSVVQHISDRIAVMYAGRIVELGPTDQVIHCPNHPYTKALLSAVPHPDPDVKMNVALIGEVADLSALPAGCAFHPRCPDCRPECRHRRPELRRLDPTSQVACHLFET